MKTLLITIALVLFYSSIALSASVKLHWDSTSNATGYKLQTSSDLGLTWGIPLDVGNVLEFPLIVPDDILVLIRNTSYNTSGEGIRTDVGIWFNSKWAIPNIPTGLGAQ